MSAMQNRPPRLRARSLVPPLAIAGLIVVAAATAVRADGQSEAVALGFQTERADVVAVGFVADDGDAKSAAGAAGTTMEYVLERVLRGEVNGADRIAVLLDPVTAEAVIGAPARHLLFLAASEDGVLRPLVGTPSVRPIPEDGPLARFPGIVARYAAALDLPGSQRDDALRAELVSQIDDEDAGIAWSGASDLYRRPELVAGMSQADTARIVAAFRSSPARGRAKEMLALAVAISGDPDAVDALADAVDADDALAMKGGLGDAAAALGGDALAAELIARLPRAEPVRRVALVSVLGRAGHADAVGAVLPYVRSDDPTLRQEALHACGNIARNVRRAARSRRRVATVPPVDAGREPAAVEPQAPEAPVSARPSVASGDWSETRAKMRVELSRAALRARSLNDKRASLWALAQLDDPAAYAFLRRLVAETEDDVVRRHAKSYLERPAQSLILR